MERQFEEVQVKYQKAVSDLSEVSPILAYRLTGGTSLFHHRKLSNQQLDTVFGQISQSNEHLENVLKSFIGNRLDIDILKFFRRRTLQLALQISIGTWFSTFRLLRIKRPPIEADTELKEFVDSLVETFAQLALSETSKLTS